MSDSNVAIGRRVAAAREALGLSQRDLAAYAGVSQPTIHRIETGHREASVTELSVLADACGVPIGDLQGTRSLADEIRCAGRTDDVGSRTLTDYMMFALGLARRLDQLGVPDVA